MTRQAFIYHYMPALYYASLLLGIVVEACVPQRAVNVVCGVFVGLSVLSYIFFSPWVYAFKSTFNEQAAMRWLSTWD